MTKRNYELSVLVGSTKIREYGHKGQTYVEGRKGQTFTLQFKNNTALRVLVVPSIDGISVIDGDPATNESRGYIVPGYQSISIKGWRTSLDESAKFVFADKPKSYSAQTQGGEEVNCGVIGVKVFTEKVKFEPLVWKTITEEHHHHHHYPEPRPPWRDPWWDRPVIWCSTTTSSPADTATYSASTGSVRSAEGVMARAEQPQAMYACCVPNKLESETLKLTSSQESLLRGMNCVVTSSLAARTPETPDFNLGTAYGDTQEDKVTTAEFERGAEDATLEIFYTDAEGLQQIGIDVSKKVAVSKPRPQAFGGFCKPPKLLA